MTNPEQWLRSQGYVLTQKNRDWHRYTHPDTGITGTVLKKDDCFKCWLTYFSTGLIRLETRAFVFPNNNFESMHAGFVRYVNHIKELEE